MNKQKQDNNLGKRIDAIIKSMLKKEQVSYQNLLDRIGIPASRLESYKEGKRPITLEDMNKLASLGVDLNFLCNGKGNMFMTDFDKLLAAFPILPPCLAPQVLSR